MTSRIQSKRRRPPVRRTNAAPFSVADALLLATDVSLAGVIFVAPLFLGGRHDFGRFVFVLFIAVASIAWFARHAVHGEGVWTRRPVHWLLLAVALLLATQLAPLPADWIAWLAPRTAALLPLWTGPADAGELGQWTTLSMSPEATRHSIAMLAAYALLFVTVSHRIQSREDAIRIFHWVGAAAAAMAVIGLLQAALPNGRFLWIYDHPSETTFDRLSGPFANRNHFAHFLILGAAPLAAWWAAASASEKKLAKPNLRPPHRAPAGWSSSANSRPPLTNPVTLLPALLLLITVLAVVLSASRGGAIALLAAAAVFGALLWRRGQFERSRWAPIAAAIGVLLCIAPLLGFEGVTRRLSTLTTASVDDLDEQSARRNIWAANLAAIKSGGLFGAGAGSHRDIYPVYLSDPSTKEHTHAENGYLQVLTETGPAGGLLLAVAFVTCTLWCVRALRRADSPQAFAYAAAGAGALAASVVHSIVDFVWYIPGCLTITIILAVCTMRLGELTAAAKAPRRQFSFNLVGSVNLAAAITLVAAFSVLELVGPAAAARHWDAYLRTSSAQRDLELKLLAMPLREGAKAREDSSPAREAALQSMIAQLEQAIAARPAFAAAHRQLASRYLELYHLRSSRSDNPMPAQQIREATIASQFRSAAELKTWLNKAFGKDAQLFFPALNHARIAARLAPLQGAPYVRLAALGFLQGHGRAAADSYLQQALTVRPYDGDLLFETGADLCVSGQIPAGLDCWVRALRIRGPHRIKVARAVAGSMPFANLIELFQPEWDTLPEFWKAYRLADATNVAAFTTYAVEQTRRESAAASPAKAALLWRRLAQVQLEAGQPNDCLASLYASRTASPDDYATRRMLGMVLLEASRAEEAAAELQWCLDRQPSDSRVADVLTQLTRDRIAAQGDTAPAAR